MEFSVVFSPHLPAALTYSLIAAAALPVAIALYAGARGSVLRALALICLAIALLNPIIREEHREGLSDIAVLVVDRSLSQEVGGRTAVTNEAARRIAEIVQSLPDTELRTAVVSPGNGSDDDGTPAFAALSEALSDIPPERYAGALMLSDGQIHDVPASLRDGGYDGPLHALITGDRKETDRRLIVDKSPRFGIVGQPQRIELRVEDQGTAPTTAPYRLTIIHDDEQATSLTARPGERIEVEIEIKHGGRNYTEIAVEALPGEIALQNNRTVVVTEGIRDRLQVLLVSGEPHPGERTWRNLLKADASVDLVHFTILRPPEKQDGTPVKELSLIAFPTRELFVEKLEEFDLIIFDRYQRRGILPSAYLTNVVDYVENGGAVLVASGPDYASPLSLYDTPLNAVLPAAPSGSVAAQPFTPSVTQQGRRHPVTRSLPGTESEPPAWGRWFRLAEVHPETSGDIVMAGPEDKPLLLLSRQGKGRVALLLSDQAWLWARGFEGGGPQTELLRRLAHWLMKEPDLEEEALFGTQAGRNLLIERRTMAEGTEPVTVTKPSGATETVTLAEEAPGVWRGTLVSSENGIHRLRDGKLTSTSALGEAGTRELEELIASDRKLAPLVAETRGGSYWLGRNPENPLLPRIVKQGKGRTLAGTGWLALRANDAYRVLSVSELPLFGTLIGLALLLGLASMTWFREGR